jgi:tRNA-binding protein
MPTIDASIFQQVDLRVGRVLAAEPHPTARDPAYVLTLDLGPELGTRRSSARLTGLYTPEELVGRLVIAVVNLPPRRVAGVVSEVLVLAAVDDLAGTVLLQPDRPVAPGTRIS